jgi:hypothetical protein
MHEHGRTGLVAELIFTATATTYGLDVALPVSDALPYDAIVFNGKKFLRVQIKACNKSTRGMAYEFRVRSGDGRTPYKSSDYDVLALFIVPRNEWIFVKTGHPMTMRFAVSGHGYKKNNWHDLTGRHRQADGGKEGTRKPTP